MAIEEIVVRDSVTHNPVEVGDSANSAVRVNVVAGGSSSGGGDGAILDGTTPTIKASVKNFTNSHPLAVHLVDTAGNSLNDAGAGFDTLPVIVEGGAVSITGPVTCSGTILSQQSGSWAVNVNNAAGASAVNVQDGGNSLTVDGSVSVSNFPATQPVSGTVAVSNFPASQTVAQATAANLNATVVGTVTANQGGAPWSQNLTQVGGSAIALKALPTNGSGQAALPVWNAAIQFATYDAGARAIVTGALTAGTAKAILSIEHGATSTKNVRIRRIIGHMIQTTALSGLVDCELHRGTAASSAGTTRTPTARNAADPAAEAVVKSLPTITAATVLDNFPLGGFATTTTLYSPPIVLYDWQEAGETKTYILRAGVLESFVLFVNSTAAHNLTLTIAIDFTEE